MRNMHIAVLLLSLLLPPACGDGTGEQAVPDSRISEQDGAGLPMDTRLDSADGVPAPLTFSLMTVNTGTTTFLNHDQDEERGPGDGYTSAHAEVVSESYSNNLAWIPAETALSDFIQKNKVDVVGFQELYYDPWCRDVQVSPGMDLICEQWKEGGSIQINRILGEDYHIVCASEHLDNCVGIRKSFAAPSPSSLVPCADVEGDDPGPADGCYIGGRTGAVKIDLPDGRTLTVVNLHTFSGATDDTMQRRRDQFKQAFEDKGDGSPWASDVVNVILGDMNMDPFYWADFDLSAAYWNSRVGEGKLFHYISSGPEGGEATASMSFRIDHIISDRITGTCVVPGRTPGVEGVLGESFWDHRPILCQVSLP